MSAFLIGGIISTANAQTTSDSGNLKGKYSTIEVVKLSVASDVDIPANQITVVWLEIVDELHKIKKFDRIIKSKSKSEPAETSLRLEGTIANYYALIPQNYSTKSGDIWTRLKVQVKFVDTATNKVIHEEEVQRRIFFGIYQLTFEDVGRKVAKEIAKITKKTFF